MIAPLLVLIASASAPAAIAPQPLVRAYSAEAQKPTGKSSDAKPKPGATKADALDLLQAEYKAWVGAMAQQKAEAVPNRRGEFVGKAEAIMKGDPRGELAVRTRVWLVAANVQPDLSYTWLDDLVTKDLASPELAALADWLNPVTTVRARELLEMLAEKAGDATVRGRSLRSLGNITKSELDGVRAVESGQIKPEALAQSLGKERADNALKLGSSGLEAQYVGYLSRIVKDYAEVRDPRGILLGPRADSALFELEHLQIGMVAPDIEAEDIGGTTFKLSDYRGKVVVLDFWGHW